MSMFPVYYPYNRQNVMPRLGTSPSMMAIASPHMNTPYLDSSLIDTPFMDTHPADTPPFVHGALDFTPFLNYNAFNMHPINNNLNKDLPVSRYLNNNGEYNDEVAAELGALPHAPVAEFNGDPSLLLIDKSVLTTPATKTISTPIDGTLSSSPSNALKSGKPSPVVKLQNLSEQEIDSLFPPLAPSSQEQLGSVTDLSVDSYSENYSSHSAKSETSATTPLLSLEEVLGFDISSSPLSEEMCFDAKSTVPADEPFIKSATETTPVLAEEAQPLARQKLSVCKSKKRSNNAVDADDDTQQKKQPVKKKARTTKATSNNANNKQSINSSTKKVSNRQRKEPKRHECPVCGHVSNRRYNLTTHMKTHDKNRIREFPCSQCLKAFDRRHDRDRHLATVHHHERSFGCQHCKVHFSRRDALNRHLMQKHGYSESDFAD